MSYPMACQQFIFATAHGWLYPMGINAQADEAANGQKYRMMSNVSMLVAVAAAVGLGLLTATFDLTQGQSFAIMALFVVALVPPNLYLHFIAKSPPQHEGRQ